MALQCEDCKVRVIAAEELKTYLGGKSMTLVMEWMDWETDKEK